MARVTFDAQAARKLEKTRAVPLGSAYEVHVRRIPGTKVYEFEAAQEAPTAEQPFRLLAILLCDAKGKPTYNQWSKEVFTELQQWPVGYIAEAVKAGMSLNGMEADDDPS